MSYSGLMNTYCTLQSRTKTQHATTHEMVEVWANAEMTVTDEGIGIGDASTKVFYTANEYVSEITVVYVNDVAKTVTTDYAVSQLDSSSKAKITFVTAPALNANITCDYKHKDTLTIPCRLAVARGGVQSSGQGILSKRTHTLFTNYRTDVTWKGSRIVVGTETFEVLLIANAGGQAHHSEIALEIVE